MNKHIFIAFAAAATLATGACQSGKGSISKQVAQEVTGTVNPFLWRASLDTLADLPVNKADPLGGLIVYDWKTFTEAPNERIKATVYILDTRLRADGVKVAVFRQTNQGGQWVDAATDEETGIQLENKILERARFLKASQISN